MEIKVEMIIGRIGTIAFFQRMTGRCLRTGQTHLLVDMIVGAGEQDTRFADAQILDKLEILFVCADPCCDLRERKTELHARLDRLSVLFGVDEEFALADDALGTAELGKQLI